MELLSRRGLHRAGVEAKAGQGWVWVKAAWGGQQAVRIVKENCPFFAINERNEIRNNAL